MWRTPSPALTSGLDRLRDGEGYHTFAHSGKDAGISDGPHSTANPQAPKGGKASGSAVEVSETDVAQGAVAPAAVGHATKEATKRIWMAIW